MASEKEYKILDVDPDVLIAAMNRLHAKQVYDGIRKIWHYDTPDHTLQDQQLDLRITQEETVKLSLDDRSIQDHNDSLKVHLNHLPSIQAILQKLQYQPVAYLEARRISWEWQQIDFDLDIFPDIPPFLECDIAKSDQTLQELLTILGLENHKYVTSSTKQIFQLYGIDYLSRFCLSSV